MRTKRHGSLAVRISLLAVAVAVITALTGGVIAIRLVRQSAESGGRETLARLADEIQTDIEVNPTRAITGLRALKVDLGLIGRTGHVTGNSSLARDALTPGQIQSVLAGISVSAVQRVDGETVLVEARPVRSGAFFIVQPRSAAVAGGEADVRRLLAALALACVIAGVLGLIVSRRVARPLRRTADAARALATGEREVVVRPDGPAEVAEVAESLNTLSASLARSESRQREFLLSVSHDLRTPLTAISGYAESLADRMIEPEQVPKVGEIVLEEAGRLNRYVSDLLDLARLDAGELRIDLSHVDVAALVDATAAVWSGRCATEGVPLTVDNRDGPVWVRTDAGRLRQALDGLLENALRVVPAGEPIVLATGVETTGAGWLALVEVRDGGPGLADEDVVVAFDRSVLYDRYRGVRKVGTGLGLAIVHRLVTRLGGTIQAGHAPEGGAQFTLRLPALPPDP